MRRILFRKPQYQRRKYIQTKRKRQREREEAVSELSVERHRNFD